MRPAFASTGQAGGFALLLLVLLLLPVLLTKSLLPPRERLYSWSGWDTKGPHPYHHQVMFEEKGDIDMLFIGSSQMAHGINTPYVQEKLSAMLGRQAIVRTLGWGGDGYDQLYFTTRDLLENRKVRMIVFYDECQYRNEVNSRAPIWFHFADDADALAGLPFLRQLTYYYAAIAGAPRNLLFLLRSNLPADMSLAKMDEVARFYNAENIVKQLGSLASHHGYNYSTTEDNYGPFVEYAPHNPTQPSDVAVYSPATQALFQFDGPAVPEWQLHFARKFAARAEQDGTKLVLLHFPTFTEMRSPVIKEREFWPKVLGADVAMVGIPSAKLLEGISDDDAHKLFSDYLHLNKNGQEYYTALITPTLLKIYAQKISP